MGKRKPRAQTLAADDPSYLNTSLFRVSERSFKRSFDLSQCKIEGTEVMEKVWTFPGPPGVVLLKDCISVEIQAKLVQYALEDWSKAPNLSNLDAHFNVPLEGIWHQFGKDPASLVEPRTFQTLATQVVAYENDEEISLTEDAAGSTKENDNLTALKIDPPTDPKRKPTPEVATQVLKRMRWVTLGYQYNWTEKEYFFDRSPPFPTELSTIVKSDLDKIEHLDSRLNCKDYKCEAGIVNFYHVSISLS